MSENYVRNKELQENLKVAARDIEETKESFSRRLLPSGDIGIKLKKISKIEEKLAGISAELSKLTGSLQNMSDKFDAHVMQSQPATEKSEPATEAKKSNKK